MKPNVHMTKVWFDDDMVELKIDVSDGTSIFSTKVYVGYDPLDQVVRGLDVFKTRIHGGLFDLRFGEFGPEWGSGAFHARFHFAKPGRLFITCKLQSDFANFGEKNVASEATLYLQTEPVLLDNFVAELKSLNAKKTDEAQLEAI